MAPNQIVVRLSRASLVAHLLNLRRVALIAANRCRLPGAGERCLWREQFRPGRHEVLGDGLGVGRVVVCQDHER